MSSLGKAIQHRQAAGKGHGYNCAAGGYLLLIEASWFSAALDLWILPLTTSLPADPRCPPCPASGILPQDMGTLLPSECPASQLSRSHHPQVPPIPFPSPTQEVATGTLPTSSLPPTTSLSSDTPHTLLFISICHLHVLFIINMVLGIPI